MDRGKEGRGVLEGGGGGVNHAHVGVVGKVHRGSLQSERTRKVWGEGVIAPIKRQKGS